MLSDVRFCLRGFARRPMFAFVVVATLALGLSINAAIFSIYDQILLRELRIPAPSDLVNFAAPGRKQGNSSCSDIGNCDEVFSYPMFRDLERFDGPFVAIAAHRDLEANLAIDGRTIAGSGLLGRELVVNGKTLTIGIYGVLSYGVVQRLREIGLRIALGAAPRNMRSMVVKQVAWMAAIGVGVGVGLASLLGAAGRTLFFGLAATDPLVPASAVLALILVVLAAAYLPARRAAHVDPVTALRGD